MSAKFEPAVYSTMKNAGYSNREIARMLGVNEASVRRGLKHVDYQDIYRRIYEEHSQPQRERRFTVTVTELD